MNLKELIALIPIYSHEGANSTCIILKDGSKLCKPYPLKKYVTNLVISIHLDPRALRFWTYKILGSKYNTPLILTSDLIFIPVKLRPSLISQDGCYGYVNVSGIKAYDDYTITLTTGEVLSTLSPKAYIQRKQKDAKLLSYTYLQHRKPNEFMWDDNGPSLE